MATIYIENRPYEANPSQNLLQVCLSLGFNLPYFCWHPAMGSVGACRQCAVKQFKDEREKEGRLIMACMTPAAPGTRISIDDPEAAAFRRSVIEGLMLNHPHDCPVCDEGGECHLQDMTMMTGHAYRRSRFPKRTFRNQYLGPLVNHEMNRCIQCYRCVRFYRDYAGGHDLNAFRLHDTVYFGRQEDGVLESEFAGNLVEICPTGVFTDATLKQHYTRKWDLQFAPSVCVHCGLGCNTNPGERYGQLRRILNRYNHEVNGFFLCDRGRFGYQFVNSGRRIRMPLIHGQPASRQAALEQLGRILSEGSRIAGIGSPRASLEANFALRALVGPERFFAGSAEPEWELITEIIEILRSGPARTPSLREIEESDAVLVLGEDVSGAAPRMALSLRQAVRQQPMEMADKLHIPRWNDAAVREVLHDAKGPLYIAAPNATRLDDIATEVYRAAPDDLARLGFAIANAVDGGAPGVSGLADDLRSLAARIAQALKEAKRPLIVSGPGCRSRAVIQAAANVAWALVRGGKPAGLTFTMPEPNSFGLALMGAGPLGEALDAVRNGGADTVVILENDLYLRSDANSVTELLERARHVVVLDHVANATSERAGLVLPAGTFAESDGTFVNNEGRAQRFFQVFVPEGDVQESWRWLRDAMIAAGRDEAKSWRNLDAITAALAEAMPVFRRIPEAAPPATFRAAGARIAREPHRYSGRTAMQADVAIHEPKPPEDPDSALAFSMEGLLPRAEAQPPPALIPFFWAPAWNSIQATFRYQSEVGGPLRGGAPGVHLVEPTAAGEPLYFDAAPPAFEPRAGEWLIVPLYEIFGSEELSRLAPAIAQLAPAPYVAVRPEAAADLDAPDGREVQVAVCGRTYRLPVRLAPDLPPGLAGLPAGLSLPPGLSFPAWCKLARAA